MAFAEKTNQRWTMEKRHVSEFTELGYSMSLFLAVSPPL